MDFGQSLCYLSFVLFGCEWDPDENHRLVGCSFDVVNLFYLIYANIEDSALCL